MTTIYTLISYREAEDGYTDRCGDYVSGTPSELFMKSYHVSEFEQLINDYAQQKFYSEEYYREITVLLDGIDTDNPPFKLNMEDETMISYEEERSSIEEKAYKKYLILLDEKRQKEDEAKQKAIQLKIEKENAIKLKIQEDELKQLKKLQEKYGTRS